MLILPAPPHCYFDSQTGMASSWTALSPSSQSSLRMWAGMWHGESAGHSCSRCTKTSMWHLRAMPDEGRGPPQAEAGLPFKMWVEGSLPWKVTPQPTPPRLLASFLSPHLWTPVCPRLLISITLSLMSRETSLCCMLLILLLTTHSRLVSMTWLIMLQVYRTRQRKCQSALYNSIYKYQRKYLGHVWLDACKLVTGRDWRFSRWPTSKGGVWPLCFSEIID